MELFGTHGTSKARTSNIVKNGFSLQGSNRGGKAGSGVYFWAASNNLSQTAIDLARNWWSWAQDRKWYYHDTDNRCSVICVSLSTTEDSFLDCSDPFFLELLYKTAKKQGFENMDCIDIAQLYDLMLSELEVDLGQSFEVIKFNTLVPSSSYSKTKNTLIKKLYSSYSAYVVRKKVKEIITILGVKSDF